jgi:general secretion pathway protein G
MIHFQCDNCGKGIKVGDAGAGKTGKCPACGAAVHVPEATAAAAHGPPPLKLDQRTAVVLGPISKSANISDMDALAGVSGEPVRAPNVKPPDLPPPALGHNASIADEILKFKNLMDEGIISPDEFATKKRQLLDLSPCHSTSTDANILDPAKASQPADVPQADSAPGDSRGSYGLGTASLVVGILSFVTCWIPVIGFPLAAIGFCLGAVGIVRKLPGFGFSIAGIIVSSVALLASLGLVLVGYGLARIQTDAYEDAARLQIGMFEPQLDTFRLHVGAYPTTAQGLQALWMQPSDLKNPNNWRGPYSRMEIPVDPWGNPYQYELIGSEQFRIWSWGADGANGTVDDVANDQ